MVIVVLETAVIWKQCVRFTAVFKVVLVRWN